MITEQLMVSRISREKCTDKNPDTGIHLHSVELCTMIRLLIKITGVDIWQFGNDFTKI